MAIQSFRCKQTQRMFEGGQVAKFANIRSIAERKLQMLDSAATLSFLRLPAGNRLEMLSGDRKGEYSIRINDQFRLCFRWTDKGPADVEIVDYH